MRIKKQNIRKIAAISLLSVGLVLVSTNTVEASTESVSRIQGANRFETAAQISQESYEQANTVIIANAREFADALAGVPLAFQHQSPILLAQGTRLNSATVDEIERLGGRESDYFRWRSSGISTSEQSLAKIRINYGTYRW